MSSTERMALLFEHRHVIEELTGSYILGVLITFFIYQYFCKDT